MFDRIAPRYDLLNRCMSAGVDQRWRRAGVDALRLAPGSRLLDLCTGTSDVLVEWLRRDLRNRGVGVDLSAQMLRMGREKLGRSGGRDRGALVVADAVGLPLSDATFDGAMVTFGIRNLSARVVAMREVARVLRPGAGFVAIELGWPQGWLGRAYRLYFSRVLPRLGGWLSGEAQAYAYLPESVRLLPAPAEIVAELSAAGFSDAAARPLTSGIAWLYRGVKPT